MKHTVLHHIETLAHPSLPALADWHLTASRQPTRVWAHVPTRYNPPLLKSLGFSTPYGTQENTGGLVVTITLLTTEPHQTGTMSLTFIYFTTGCHAKELIVSSQVLVHFDPKLRIRLACDASDYGIGTVLSHVMPDGSEKPVGFVSWSLTASERKYSQIEKEALACVVGVTHFHVGSPFHTSDRSQTPFHIV